MEPELIRKRSALLAPLLDGRRLRLSAGAEALALGYGGIALVSQATGSSRPPITAGCTELLAAGQSQPLPAAAGRLRTPGGGGKRPVNAAGTLGTDLASLLAPRTRGAPESPVRGTSKRVRQLADARKRRGPQASHRLRAALLQARGDRLQANRQPREGSSQPDREAPFEPMHPQGKAFQAADQPVIAVETNKTALVGEFYKPGRELRP
jgi:hypothetical protein